MTRLAIQTKPSFFPVHEFYAELLGFNIFHCVVMHIWLIFSWVAFPCWTLASLEWEGGEFSGHFDLDVWLFFFFNAHSQSRKGQIWTSESDYRSCRSPSCVSFLKGFTNPEKQWGSADIYFALVSSTCTHRHFFSVSVYIVLMKRLVCIPRRVYLCAVPSFSMTWDNMSRWSPRGSGYLARRPWVNLWCFGRHLKACFVSFRVNRARFSL